PKRFNLSYIDDTGKEKQPIMLHRVLLGSLERFIGALIEHYKGELPLWLSPCQVLVIPVKETALDYARSVKRKLEEREIRAEIDLRNETLDKKIRNAEINKIPYCLILGDREARDGQVSVRKKGSGNQGAVSTEEFMENLLRQIRERR
ncbi:MAG: His/Gly/Thr/Pro-type tRNA ligase C-terminal domain-containing protein, partial [Candidatus Omnitrophica bacterium]|nr:His/Gly/Thr/Pro-type tRNA ligase C-terminal domain-containing protein [Candidatus Omnitrophota bacterium]